MTRICIEIDGNGASTEPQVRTYSTVLGDGSQSDFNVDHELNSQGVFLNAYDASTGERVEDYSVTYTNANRAVLRFDAPPANQSVRVQAVSVTAPPAPQP